MSLSNLTAACPEPLLEVDMRPPQRGLVVAIVSDDVPRPDSAKDEELQRACGHAGARAQVLHKGADLGVRQRGVMLDLVHFGARREEVR